MEKRKQKLIEFRKNEINYYQYDWYYIPNTNNTLIVNKEGTIVETNNFKVLRVYLSKNYKKIFHQGSYWDYDKLVAETFIMHPIHKYKLIHIDGDTLNNNITNLRWVNPNKQYNIILNDNFNINKTV